MTTHSHLKEHKFIIEQFFRTSGQKFAVGLVGLMKGQQSCVPSGSSLGESVSLTFLFSEAVHVP